MKTKVQKPLIIFAAFVLAAGWIWRFNCVKNFYHNLFEKANDLTDYSKRFFLSAMIFSSFAI